MKIKKLITTISLISVITISTSIGVKAQNLSTTKVSTNNSIKESVISRYSPEIRSKYFGKNKKILSISQKYIKITNVSNDKTHPKYVNEVHTKADYLKDIKAEKITESSNFSSKNLLSTNEVTPINDRQDHGWIALTAEVDSTGGSNFDFYGYYEWLKAPLYTKTDVISLGHDSNVVFDFKNNFCVNSFYYSDTISPANEVDNKQTPSSSNTKQEVGGIGYKFNLSESRGMGDNGQVLFPFGFVYTKGTTASTTTKASNFILSYAHQQVVFSGTPMFSIPSGGSLLIKAEKSYDIVAQVEAIKFK